MHAADARDVAACTRRRIPPRTRPGEAPVALVAALLAALALLAGSQPAALGAVAVAPAPARTSALRAMEASILERLNAVRTRRGLAALRLASGLERAAGSHVRTLATEGVFTHEVGGVSPSTRIRRFYPGSLVAEVLQWRSPTLTPEQAVAAWLASAPHRAIILSAQYSEIGLAARAVPNAPGYYGGRPATIVVADLGSR